MVSSWRIITQLILIQQRYLTDMGDVHGVIQITSFQPKWNWFELNVKCRSWGCCICHTPLHAFAIHCNWEIKMDCLISITDGFNNINLETRIKMFTICVSRMIWRLKTSQLDIHWLMLKTSESYGNKGWAILRFKIRRRFE